MEKVQISKNLVGSPLLVDILQGKKRVKMENVTLKQKYAKVKKQLHVCMPYEKPMLKALFNYYYGLLLKGGK